jgi:tyrosinase-like protein/VWA domain-containing protein
MKCRKNVKSLTPGEKTRFVNAFLALMSEDSVLHPGAQSRYDDFVETHLLAMHDMDTHAERPESWGHGGSVFLPWHRELLYQFEQLLQDIDSSVTIPYWDWTRAKAPGDAGYPFMHDFLAVDGTDGNNDRVEREAGAPSPYPYAFDPENWSSSLTVFDPDDGLNFFQRQFGEFDIAGTDNDAPDLPSNDTVETGTGTTFRDAISGAITYTTHRARCEDLHNLVHRYCGGNMLRMTSPNDPIFFLHHANIDRMWSIWQKKVAPGTSLYVQSSATAGHKLNDAMLFNEAGDPAPFTTGATPAQMIDGHALHGDGVWYESDIPEIDVPPPGLSFDSIPEGLTSYKAVSFKIKGCRQVRFRITGNPTGDFGLTPMGAEFVATPVEADDFFYGYVWVQLTAPAGAVPNSSVTIHAYIIDDEGYYAAAEGDEFALGDYTVTLSATTVPRENNAVALVLDRSGSMGANAGGTSTRSQLLGNAIGVFRDLMLANDEVSVTTFDDLVDTPIPMQAVSGAPAFGTVDLTPRGDTWIGGGIQDAVPELAAATHTNRSMVVLTDGNENVHPYIAELPAGTITNRTYAIGFGLPGDVSDEALNDITSNTNGDMIITGNITSEEQRFMLTKYFVQVLAGVTNAQVLLDPQGKLYAGGTDTIPFKVADADVYVDAIVVCPIPAFLEFVLQSPGGDFIKPTTTGPNVQWIAGQQVQCYRMVLPALAASAAGSHAGTWQAILRIKDDKERARLLRNKQLAATVVSPAVNKYLPYSFIVHATSNLCLKAWRVQNDTVPGSTVSIHATLKAYDVPFDKRASVWAEVTLPDGSSQMLKLTSSGDGRYAAVYATSLAGVYVFRVKAEGLTAGGSSWTRETTLTAGVFRKKSVSGGSDRPGGDHGRLCEWVRCLLKEHSVLNESAWKRLLDLGVDVKLLLECIDELCPDLPKEHIPVLRRRVAKAIKMKTTKAAAPQTVAGVKFAKAAVTRPIVARRMPKKKVVNIKEVRQPTFQTMFTRLDLAKAEQRGTTKKGKGDKGHHH